MHYRIQTKEVQVQLTNLSKHHQYSTSYRNQNKRLYTVVTGNEDDNDFYRPINDAGQNIDGNGIEVVGIETLPGKRYTIVSE